MVKHYFSIGEVSKLFNLSVQALRLYDQLGIVKPSYVNEDNGYRYYTLDQFTLLDFLKVCKASQVPLKEIKEILDQPLTVEHTKQLLQTQENILAEQIASLTEVKNGIARKRGDIERWQERLPQCITVLHLSERPIAQKRVQISSEVAFELMYRELLLTFDKTPSFLSFQTGVITSRQAWLDRNECTTTHMFVTYHEEVPEGFEKATIPEGTFLSLIIEDSYLNYMTYYEQLRSYVEKNGIEPLGELYELYVMSLPGTEKNGGKDKTLWELQVQINPLTL
ncbi:UNVERIFIED_CONTAM: MerR family transcriptional activator of bmr gene [Brevibacillus sp. OAP136]